MPKNHSKIKLAANRVAVNYTGMNKFKIGILGNLKETYQPHYQMNTAFSDLQDTFDFSFDWIPTESLINNAPDILNVYHGIVAGSGPYQSKEGVINGIRYARQNNIPFLGTCSGFGYAVLEFGQSLFQLPTVHHPYEDVELKADEIFLQPLSFCGTGMHTINFRPVAGTLTDKIYDHAALVYEESHCTYGVNTQMTRAFEKEGLLAAGTDEENEPKIMEYNRNNFFIITLFLPQLKHDLQKPHPLILAFLEASCKLDVPVLK
jgi:CTP synthase (UTP-ammonia lyase)